MVKSDRIPEGARRVLIGANPRAGTGNRKALIESLCQELFKAGFEPTVHCEIDELAIAAARVKKEGTLRAAVAAGGDGTFRLLAERTAPGTPLAVLPLGTENLLARYMGFTADAAALVEIIATGKTIELDAGIAGTRVFTMMAGCGFDAEVVRRLHRERKGNIRHLSYARPILDAIRQYEYPELRIYYAPPDSTSDDLTAEISARWVFVVNLPRYAGGLSFAPQASGTDGLLDVCTFKEGSLLYGLMYLGGVIFGQHEGMQDFTHIRTKRVRVEAAGPAPYQLDGDPGGELPTDFGIAPGRIRLLVPPTWSERRSE